ncbi:hypothetical protein DXU07_27405 [Bradyrhizobium elkanii]|nr:hypothetical protein [Bradyrhizobium elkanii]NWL74548.1 hypothetical protein [Bradyrhizobium elkanii]RYM15998.1 hypothetical protein EWH13_39955 [Bradyrhizobium elkanii]
MLHRRWTCRSPESRIEAGPALRDQAIAYPHRHGRACPGHPRLSHAETETWMPGTRPGMTGWGGIASDADSGLRGKKASRNKG